MKSINYKCKNNKKAEIDSLGGDIYLSRKIVDLSQSRRTRCMQLVDLFLLFYLFFTKSQQLIQTKNDNFVINIDHYRCL